MLHKTDLGADGTFFDVVRATQFMFFQLGKKGFDGIRVGTDAINERRQLRACLEA